MEATLRRIDPAKSVATTEARPRQTRTRRVMATREIGPPPVEHIIAIVAECAGLTVEQMTSASRLAYLAHARMAAMTHLRRAGYSQSRIGRWLGRADHTTIWHGLARYEFLQTDYAHVAAWEAAIRARLAAGSGATARPQPAGDPAASWVRDELARVVGLGAAGP